MRSFVILLAPILLTACATRPPTVRWHEAIPVDPHLQLLAQITSLESRFGEPPYTREQAFHALLNADRFLPVPYGFDPGCSPMTVAFLTLVKQPDAPQAFVDLARRGTPEGKLYGLCGLYLSDRRKFAQALPRFTNSNESATIAMGGCIIAPEPLPKIVEGITHGDYPVSLINCATEYDNEQQRRRAAQADNAPP